MIHKIKITHESGNNVQGNQQFSLNFNSSKSNTAVSVLIMLFCTLSIVNIFLQQGSLWDFRDDQHLCAKAMPFYQK